MPLSVLIVKLNNHVFPNKEHPMDKNIDLLSTKMSPVFLEVEEPEENDIIMTLLALLEPELKLIVPPNPLIPVEPAAMDTDPPFLVLPNQTLNAIPPRSRRRRSSLNMKGSTITKSRISCTKT